jgi:hypothetical protein
MMVEEIYYTKQPDTYGIIGAQVIDIAIGENGKKAVVLQKQNGDKFHLEATDGKHLTICQQFQYVEMEDGNQ